uniref:Uncharacterized protein n=1 Tax=Anguilla anguilla TaxID=7936 RepID=A0A0E9RDR3_ANGAN
MQVLQPKLRCPASFPQVRNCPRRSKDSVFRLSLEKSPSKTAAEISKLIEP